MRRHTAGNGRLFYMMYFAAAACLLPYLGLYLRRIGLPGDQIGLLLGIKPMVMVTGAAIWSAFADRTGRHRTVLVTACYLSAALGLVLVFPSHVVTIGAILFLFAFIYAPIIPAADNAVMTGIATNGGDYGRVRLFGAIGWGVASIVIGFIVENTTITVVFGAYAAVMVACGTTAFALPRPARVAGVKILANLPLFFRDRRWVLFVLVAFFAGMANSVVHNFLFIYLDQLGAPETTMGAALAVATVSELFFFFFSARLIRRFGADTVLAIGLGVTAVRLAAYALIRAPAWALVVQLCHGPGFAAMYVAGVSRAREIAPRGLGATAQSVFYIALSGLGGTVGVTVGGILFERYDVFVMFAAAAVGAAIAAAVFILAGRRRASRPSGADAP